VYMYIVMSQDYIFTCLHCKDEFIIHITDFNCKILRHGAYKHNLQPINPHATKEECDALVASEKIYGCGGPLQITKHAESPPGYSVVICNYI